MGRSVPDRDKLFYLFLFIKLLWNLGARIEYKGIEEPERLKSHWSKCGLSACIA